MTTSRTQLGFLDLEAFYMAADRLRSFAQLSSADGHHFPPSLSKSVTDICDKLMCVIDAIRADGLDPRWHPEVDALDGLIYRTQKVGNIQLSRDNAEAIIESLHCRGYKIVKDGER